MDLISPLPLPINLTNPRQSFFKTQEKATTTGCKHTDHMPPALSFTAFRGASAYLQHGPWNDLHCFSQHELDRCGHGSLSFLPSEPCQKGRADACEGEIKGLLGSPCPHQHHCSSLARKEEICCTHTTSTSSYV